jgi:hypothetical protein
LPLTPELADRKYLDRIRTRAGPFTNDGIFDGSMVAGQMDKMKIL